MLQVTPLLLGSFVTVAVKSWLLLVRRLAVAGTTATEIAGPPPPGAVVSEPQAEENEAHSGERSAGHPQRPHGPRGRQAGAQSEALLVSCVTPEPSAFIT